MKVRFGALAIVLALALAASVSGADFSVSLKGGVSDERLSFTWTAHDGAAIELNELPAHTAADIGHEAKRVWTGDLREGGAHIARYDAARDRLYSKFQIADAATHQPLSDVCYITNFAELQHRTPALPPAPGKKGLACILDIADASALGMQQAAENIDIGGLFALEASGGENGFEFEGHRFPLRAAAVAALDRDLLSMHAAGLRVTGVLLNYVHPGTPRTSPLVHPLTDPAAVPVGPAAFNTATAEGLLYYQAIVHWLVERYSRPDARYGQLAGLVIGNEVQSHWTWYHLGAVEPAVLLRAYYIALRMADLAARSVNVDFPIYISLEHHWTLPASEDKRKGITGVEVLEGIGELGRKEGDFPWNLAFHPYPENLGEPRFWLDKTAPHRFDAPRVTFHNLEILPAFLRQDRFLYLGKPRRIALTEQGFHCPDGADGELLQAAAYALAWKKVEGLPEIESFIYHRHVDHPLEGGLRCGLRAFDAAAPGGIGRARQIWKVVQAAGTPGEDAAFAFALPVIGRANWEGVNDAAPVAPR